MTAVPATFVSDGFIGPVRIFTKRECRILSEYLRKGPRPQPADWQKGSAVTDWLLYRIASSPHLLTLLTPLLGEDILLWGCSTVRRRPGEAHPWHVDIETSDPKGRYVSAWIGLENTKQSALQFIAGSHALGKTVQQIQRDQGYRRGEATTDTVLEWARQGNPHARLVEPQLRDGEAVLFDGGLWHASDRCRAGRTRAALLLQFAAADSAVYIPNFNQLEWPFRFLSAPRPGTVLVQGEATGDANRVVRPPVRPSPKGLPMLSSCIHSLDLPLAEHPEGGWQPYPLFRGATPIVDDMSCHAAVLSAGHSPHAPHIHGQEELLIVLDGEAELIIADSSSAVGARVERVHSGDFAYYPAGQHHTIRNPGRTPVTYLMFKWRAEADHAPPDQLGTTVFHDVAPPEPRNSTGFDTRTIFQQPTAWLGRLHCHTTQLAPGAGYASHIDAHDVAILMQSGRVETLGQEVGPGSVIYYSAGESHGMRNIADEPVRYLVFEFHAAGVALRRPPRRSLKRVTKRVLKRIVSALGVLSQQPERRRARAAAIKAARPG